MLSVNKPYSKTVRPESVNFCNGAYIVSNTLDDIFYQACFVNGP